MITDVFLDPTEYIREDFKVGSSGTFFATT